MVEQPHGKGQVVGPIPTLGSARCIKNKLENAGMAEWSIATVCKTVARTGYVGSNPTPGTVPLISRKNGGILVFYPQNS